MEISNLSDAEFKTLVIRMLKELSDYFNGIKKKQAEMKAILMEMNNLQVISKVDEAENHTMIWNIGKQKSPCRTTRRKKNKKNEDHINSLWDNFKRSNIHIIGLPEE